MDAGFRTRADYMFEQQERAMQEDSFLGAFGNKPGSTRRAERRRRKGWDK